MTSADATQDDRWQTAAGRTGMPHSREISADLPPKTAHLLNAAVQQIVVAKNFRRMIQCQNNSSLIGPH
jgi:hypothetical protein